MAARCPLFCYKSRKIKGNPFAIANGWFYRHPSEILYFETFASAPFTAYFLTPRRIYRHLCSTEGDFRMAFPAAAPGFTDIVYTEKGVPEGFLTGASTVNGYKDGILYAASYDPAPGTFTVSLPEILPGESALIELIQGKKNRYHLVQNNL